MSYVTMYSVNQCVGESVSMKILRTVEIFSKSVCRRKSEYSNIDHKEICSFERAVAIWIYID